MEVLAFGLILSIALERFVELAVKPALKPSPDLVPFVAAVLGVVFAVAFNLDAFAAFGHPAAFPYVGAAITGLFLGGGSGLWNDFVSLVGGRSPVLLAAPSGEPAPAAPVETPKAA